MVPTIGPTVISHPNSPLNTEIIQPIYNPKVPPIPAHPRILSTSLPAALVLNSSPRSPSFLEYHSRKETVSDDRLIDSIIAFFSFFLNAASRRCSTAFFSFSRWASIFSLQSAGMEIPKLWSANSSIASYFLVTPLSVFPPKISSSISTFSLNSGNSVKSSDDIFSFSKLKMCIFSLSLK